MFIILIHSFLSFLFWPYKHFCAIYIYIYICISFFRAAVVSILLYGCTTWTLTKRLKKKLDGNYKRMQRAILNMSWRQHPTRHQLYGHLPPITKTVQVRRTRHAGHCWRSKYELINDILLLTPHMAKKKQDDQLEHTYSSYVRIRDVVLKTCQKRSMIGRSGERGSEISVLAALHDDDDIYICVYIYIYILSSPDRLFRCITTRHSKCFQLGSKNKRLCISRIS